MSTEPYMVELNRLKDSGAFDRLIAIVREDYTSGTKTSARTVRIKRSSGHWSSAVVVGMGHAGLTTAVKLRNEKGGKYVKTMDLVEWNPWLEGEAS